MKILRQAVATVKHGIYYIRDAWRLYRAIANGELLED